MLITKHQSPHCLLSHAAWLAFSSPFPGPLLQIPALPMPFPSSPWSGGSSPLCIQTTQTSSESLLQEQRACGAAATAWSNPTLLLLGKGKQRIKPQPALSPVGKVQIPPTRTQGKGSPSQRGRLSLLQLLVTLQQNKEQRMDVFTSYSRGN